MPEEPVIPPITQRQLELGREALAKAPGRLEAFKSHDSGLEAYLRRVHTRLEVLFDNPPTDTDAGWILGAAFRSLIPILDLDWLPAEPRKESELTEELLTSFRNIRDERKRLEFENSFVPPGAARYKLALIDLLLETLQVLVLYPNRNLELASVALLDGILNAASEEAKDGDPASPALVS